MFVDAYQLVLESGLVGVFGVCVKGRKANDKKENNFNYISSSGSDSSYFGGNMSKGFYYRC